LQDHLKERLTGAAILVAIVVLLVPELFRGRPPPGSGAAAASPSGAPMHSVTIDLRDGAVTRPVLENPIVDATASAPAVAGAAAPIAPVAAPPVVTAAVQPAATPPAATADTAPAAAAKPHAKPTPVPTTPAATAPASAAPSAATGAATASHPGGVQSGWTVQVGSFSRRDYAEHMVKDLAAKGFTVEVAGPDDRGLYRVRSPPRADRAAALALKQKMQASGLKPIVNKTP
jgi:DedD protein